MGVQLTDGAVLMCSFGVAPSMLNVVVPTVTAGSMPAANILDAAPMVNIMPFGMCITPSNPEVAAATAAALGVLTPMPCVPVTEVWAPGVPTVLLRGAPAADDTCMCMCDWGGVITPTFPGQVIVTDG
jgi:hypothetical protein